MCVRVTVLVLIDIQHFSVPHGNESIWILAEWYRRKTHISLAWVFHGPTFMFSIAQQNRRSKELNLNNVTNKYKMQDSRKLNQETEKTMYSSEGEGALEAGTPKGPRPWSLNWKSTGWGKIRVSHFIFEKCAQLLERCNISLYWYYFQWRRRWMMVAGEWRVRVVGRCSCLPQLALIWRSPFDNLLTCFWRCQKLWSSFQQLVHVWKDRYVPRAT